MSDQQKSLVWYFLGGFIGAMMFFGVAHGFELKWQQRDEAVPVVAWRVRRVLSPTPIGTILRTMVPEETVTPALTPWFPTPGPGTPTPIVRQYRTDIDVQGGWNIVLQAEDAQGGVSTDSNIKVIPTFTPTPANSFTPSNTRTQSATRTATKKNPEPPHVMP